MMMTSGESPLARLSSDSTWTRSSSLRSAVRPAFRAGELANTATRGTAAGREIVPAGRMSLRLRSARSDPLVTLTHGDRDLLLL
jgi:hypothetical protein